MHRLVIAVLLAMLVAALPVWPFDKHWSYGPAIAVGFLLLINLAMFLGERVGRAPREP
jgi:hypothetical protein